MPVVERRGQARDTLALGAELAPRLEPGLVIYLSGELGAGKTTLARLLLRLYDPTSRVFVDRDWVGLLQMAWVAPSLYSRW